ncbi:unnamed protein product [Cuscuta epithymum]|uniref:ABC transporter domain-containing protein n=1 Tax=Cuscuta epithymum TaxID=186058 RepID=A0AAV0DU77_9ASTE|nr:unnamed protein product [Cuscuta epithymum]
MDLLPVKTPRYKIEAKNLSFTLPSKDHDEFDWTLWKRLALIKRRNSNIRPYILRNVNCEARDGEITAIAGPSGAGKTTLLDILAGNKATSSSRVVSGQVLVNGQPMNPPHFRRISGYVTQDEALFPHLTVEETLTYSARFRLGLGRREAKERVAKLLKELGLDHVAGMRIGSIGSRRISGGEKRRVSIGVELVHNPSVLLLDEPTSGLDSAAALHVASLLQRMAKNQSKTVVLTIHQPGFRVLELFDKVVLLSHGFILHSGSLQLLEEKLKSSGYSIPLHVNVLELAIEVFTADYNHHVEIIDDDYNEGDAIMIKEGKTHFSSNDSSFHSNFAWKEVLILSMRFCSNIFRSKELFLAKLMQAPLVGVLLGSVFLNTYNNHDPNKKMPPQQLQNQLGFFAFSLTFLLSSNVEALPILLEEKRVVMRETSWGAYRISTYTIANALVFLPFLLLVALMYAVPVYWLVGLRPKFDGFLYYCLISWMIFLMGNSFVSACSALVPNFIVGMSLIGCVIGSFFLFSGYFIGKESIPKFWVFVHYLSLFKYPFECFLINEYGGEYGRGKCVQRVGGECVMYGDQLLEQEGLRESKKWINLVVMLAYILGYRFLSFLILWCRSYINYN